MDPLIRVWDNREKEYSPGMPLVMLAGWIMGMRTKGRDLNDFEFFCSVGRQKDKIGRLLWEGDIVLSRKRIGIIDWRRTGFYFGYQLHGPAESTEDFFYTWVPQSNDCIVLGNIKQNPELLQLEAARPN